MNNSNNYFIIVLYLIFLVSANVAKKCDSNSVKTFECSESQMCDSSTSSCVCLTGYKYLNETHCLKPETVTTSTPKSLQKVANNDSSSSGGSSSILGYILIPVSLISLVIFGIYVSKKYKVTTWFRSKIYQRNNNYDEFMIGQDDDDPPLH